MGPNESGRDGRLSLALGRRPAILDNRFLGEELRMEANKRRKFSLEDKIRAVCSIELGKLTAEQAACELGVSADRIARWKREVYTYWLNQIDSQPAQPTVCTDSRLSAGRRKSETEKLQLQLRWLKQTIASRLTRQERAAWIERNPDAPPLSVQSELLGLNRSSLYYRPVSKKETLRRRVADIQNRYPNLGSRSIAKLLQREGLPAYRSTVQRYMRQAANQNEGQAAAAKSARSPEVQLYASLLLHANFTPGMAAPRMDIPSVRLQYGWMDVYGGYH
jgi:putative transposase